MGRSRGAENQPIKAEKAPGRLAKGPAELESTTRSLETTLLLGTVAAPLPTAGELLRALRSTSSGQTARGHAPPGHTTPHGTPTSHGRKEGARVHTCRTPTVCQALCRGLRVFRVTYSSPWLVKQELSRSSESILPAPGPAPGPQTQTRTRRRLLREASGAGDVLVFEHKRVRFENPRGVSRHLCVHRS